MDFKEYCGECFDAMELSYTGDYRCPNCDREHGDPFVDEEGNIQEVDLHDPDY